MKIKCHFHLIIILTHFRTFPLTISLHINHTVTKDWPPRGRTNMRHCANADLRQGVERRRRRCRLPHPTWTTRAVRGSQLRMEAAVWSTGCSAGCLPSLPLTMDWERCSASWQLPQLHRLLQVTLLLRGCSGHRTATLSKAMKLQGAGDGR